MKQINTLLEGVQTGAAGGSRDGRSPAGKAGDGSGAGAGAAGKQGGRDHVDAINQMFAEFELAYHNQFHRAWSREGSLGLAKQYWLGCLGRFSPDVIVEATRALVSSQEYLPSLSIVIQACENALWLFGLPSAHDAYVEACRAPHPKSAYPWSHPAVYHAGRAADWFALAGQPESRIFPVFEYHYKQLCNRVLNGERLDIAVPEPLPAATARTLTPEQNRRRLKKMRKQLKL